MKRVSKKKATLTTEGLVLIINILNHLNALLLHDMTYGTLDAVSKETTEHMESRLKRRIAYKGRVPNSNHDINGRFFGNLNALLTKFIQLDGLGNNYDKQLAKELLRISTSLREITGEGDAS